MIADYREYALSKREKFICTAVAGAVGIALMLLFYGKGVFCLIGIGLGFAAWRPYAAHLAGKRRKILKLQFRDLLYSMSASIGAGHHMKAALEEGITNLHILYPKEDYLAAEMSAIIGRIECSHEPEKELLLDFAARSGIEDIRSFFDVYYICLGTGGNLTAVIRKAGDILIDKMTIERDIESYTAQKRFEGRLIMVMPIAIIFFLNIVSPGYLTPMYSSWGGRIAMSCCLLAMFFALRMTEKIMSISVHSGSIKDELPDFINKTVLLMNAGLVLTAAFDVIVCERGRSGDGFYGRLEEINNNLKASNASFVLEFRKYAVETGEREMLRLSNIINDNIDKGSELTYKLEREAELMWNTVKKSAEEKGRLAESKLSFPMGILMCVLIAVTTMPAFLAM